MKDPALVADCVAALKSATSLPVTVKHRTGIDQQDDYEILAGFAATQIDAGAEALIVHARNAWLQGLNPKQNREIPPLKYDWVYRLKQDFPTQEIIINGGLTCYGGVSRKHASTVKPCNRKPCILNSTGRLMQATVRDMVSPGRDSADAVPNAAVDDFFESPLPADCCCVQRQK